MNNVKDQLSWLESPFNLVSDQLSRKMLKKAYAHANSTSPDPSTKNGSILIGLDGDILSYGVNRFPTGIAETKSRLEDKPTKYRLVVHAEDSAVLNAARNGRKVSGATLYCPYYACCDCAKAIIQGGIRRVVGHAQLMIVGSAHTTWVKSIVDAWEMLIESGVQCDLYDGNLDITTRFNGKDIVV